MRLSSSLLSAAGLALVGAVVSVGAVTARFSSRSALVLGMDQEKSPVLSGFWDPEVDGATSFQWTKARADVILPDLNRRTFWQCAIRFRGARPAGVAEPTVDVAVDGVTILSVSATNEFQDAAVTIPASPRPGTRVTIASAPTFHAPPDPREFGVQVDSVECHPDPAPFALPPFSALRGAAVAGAAWGAAFGLAGASAGLSIPMTVAVTATQSLPLMAGVAPYSGFSQRAEWLSLWICSAMVLTIAALDRRARWQLSAAARFVVLFSGAVLYVKLLGLLHPAKIAQDAVFHAHNLEKLLDGRVFFTQPMPSGVQFPYAVALYVAAAPWVATAIATSLRVNTPVTTLPSERQTSLTTRAPTSSRFISAAAVASVSGIRMVTTRLGLSRRTVSTFMAVSSHRSSRVIHAGAPGRPPRAARDRLWYT